MIQFKPQYSRVASQLERGDKYDRSVVFLLGSMTGDHFLIEKRGSNWIVTAGKIIEEEPKPKEVSDVRESKEPAKRGRTRKSKS